MKTAISFFSALVLTVLIGFSFAPEKSNVPSKATESAVCEIAGYNTWPLADYYCYDQNTLVYHNLTTRAGSFRVPNLTSSIAYRIVVTFKGCTATVNNVHCPADLYYNNIPYVCE